MWNTLPNGFETGIVSTSTIRFEVPSTSKSIRKLKKCWWLGAEMFGATIAPNSLPSAFVFTPWLRVVPVSPT